VLVMALQLPSQQQQQQQQQRTKPQTVLLYEPNDDETGLSIKASSDAHFIILTSSIEVGNVKPAAIERIILLALDCSSISSSCSSSSCKVESDVVLLPLYEHDEGETGLSIKASSDGHFIILISNADVSDQGTQIVCF
jgi:predicted aspartyl protease